MDGGISQGCQPLLKGGLAYLGRRGLERLCSGDQFASRECGGQRITLICRSLREAGWRHERFEKGKKQEGILAGQARLCPGGRGGKRALRTSGLARFPGIERVRRGRKRKLGREVVSGLEGLGCICQRISSGRK